MRYLALLAAMFLLAGCGSRSRLEELEENPVNGNGESAPVEKAKPATKVNLRFVYNQCNDVKAIRAFYGDLLGMKVGAFSDTEKFGWVTFQGEGLEFMFFRADSTLPVSEEFSFIPGDGGGPRAACAWSIEVPEAEFAATFRRLRDAKVKAQTVTPTWRQQSYWGFTVLDPMGSTVEVYCSVKEKPDSTEWED